MQKRYKRFLADIILDSGELITAHVPNTGSMKECVGVNWKCLLTKSQDPKRKLPYTLEMTHNENTWIGVNTHLTNHLVEEALNNQVISELRQYASFQREVRLDNSRLDFFLSQHPTAPDCYLEVKNVTLKNDSGMALFPDAVTTRGLKHLEELIELKLKKYRAIIFFVVNRMDVKSFSVAKEIDPEYAKMLIRAVSLGVEVLVYQTHLSENEIKLSHSLPWEP